MDYSTWTLLGNTLLLTAATSAVSLPLGTALAWLLVRTDLPARRPVLLMVGLLPFVPLYLQAAAWQAGFGAQGWCTRSFAETVWLAGWRGAIWIHAMAAVPWVVLIVGMGLRLVEAELEEQALLDGSPRQVFFRVTLRGALPAVGVAALWTAIVTAGEMTVTDLFAVRTYAEVVYTRAAVGMEPGEAPLAALPGMIVIALLVAAGLVLSAKLAPRDRPASLQRPWVFKLGWFSAPAVLFVAAMLLLLVAVPLGDLLYQAGVIVIQTETGRLRSWSPGKCLAILADAPWRNRREFGWSLLIGPCAATAAVAAGGALAWLARRGGLRALGVLALTAACLAVPGPVLGLLVIALLNRPNMPWLFNLYDHSILRPGWSSRFARCRRPRSSCGTPFEPSPATCWKAPPWTAPGRSAACGTSSCRCGSGPSPWPGWWRWPWPWATWPPASSCCRRAWPPSPRTSSACCTSAWRTGRRE